MASSRRKMRFLMDGVFLTIWLEDNTLVVVSEERRVCDDRVAAEGRLEIMRDLLVKQGAEKLSGQA